MKIAPSILSADFANLERDIKLVEKGGADYIHIDVMDGHFVPNLTFGPNVVNAVRPITKLPLDCHLMISNPDDFIEDFVRAGADIISVHAETTSHIHRTIQRIQELGSKAGIVINPGTPVSLIESILGDVDLVLVMTVNPGYGGQSFIDSTLEKISYLKQLREIKKYTYEIEVDGGINQETVKKCVDAGADVFVAGSYIYDAEDPLGRIDQLREAITK